MGGDKIMKITLLALGSVLCVLSAPFAAHADTTIPEYLRLNFANSSTYADSDIYFIFSTAKSNVSSATTFANFSGNILATGTYSAATLSGTATGGGQFWSEGNLYSGTNAAYTGRYVGYSLAELKGGIDLAYADSTTIYVSLGAPMFLTGTNSIATNGTPSYSNTADPNWGVRWQPFEITRTSTFINTSGTQNGTRGDLGNLTAINSYAVPMRISNFTASSTTPLQTVTSVDSGAGNDMRDALKALAVSNTANNGSGYGGLPADWYITNTATGEFVRQIAPSSGVTGIFASATSNGQTGTGYMLVPMTNAVGGTFFTNNTGTVPNNAAQTVVGPYPTFAPYVQYTATANGGNSYQTPLAASFLANGTANWEFSATASAVAYSGGTYTSTWQNRLGVNGAVSGSNSGSFALTGTGYAIQVSGSIYATGGPAALSNGAQGGQWVGTFMLTLPPDQLISNGGAATAAEESYNQAFSIYGSSLAPANNVFEFTDLTGNYSNLSGTYFRFNDLPYDEAIWSQVVHDLSVGYNLGLIASTATIAGYGSGTTLNDMGSPGWTDFKNIFTSGTYTGTGVLPVYNLAWGGSDTGYYNQWSATIEGQSDSIYGNPYSDYAQPVGINVNSAPVTGDAIATWNIEILPDVIPEVSTWALVLLGFASVWLVRRRKGSPQS